MKSEDHILLTLKSKGDNFEFSDLECKLDEINKSSIGLESFCENFKTLEFKSIDKEVYKLLIDTNSLSLTTKFFDLDLKCNKIINICDNCVLALYGYFYSDENLKLKLCGKPVEEVCEAISELKGSYSLVYISLHNGYVFISKDEYGFKSLLISFQPFLTVSNTATNTNYKSYELPPFVLFILGDYPFFHKRSKNQLHQLIHPKYLNYKNLNYELVSSVIDQVNSTLVECVLDVCKHRSFSDTVTILFSGGLDSSLLSLIVLNNLENVSVELINIAFGPDLAPDRITCFYTFEELVDLFPDKDLKLILVDVKSEDYIRDENEIYSLCYPNNTHMDLNISASLYYVGTLKGYILTKEFLKSEKWLKFKKKTSVLKSVNFKVTVSKDRSPNRTSTDQELEESFDHSDICLEMNEELTQLLGVSKEYTSNSKEVIMGTGADELFGGYGRHVSAKMFDEDKCFSEEINKDILRLWKRNLGRDDRVLNFRNLKALYPFLSSNLISCLEKLPFSPSVVIDYLNPPVWFTNLGFYKYIDVNTLLNSEFVSRPGSRSVSVFVNKWILREICFRYGLRCCCNFKKRAIQFGSKSAKVFNRIHNMSNRQASNKGASNFTPT